MSTVQTNPRPSLISALKNLNLRSYGMIIALVLIMLLFQFLNVSIQNENFITPLNLTNVILQNSYILILAIGMMLVIVNGHIDLSVGSVLAFCGAMSAIALSQWDWPWYLAVLFAVALGALIGVWQAFWIAYVRIPAFIVTLAGMLIFRGLTLKALDAETIGTNGTFNELASGYAFVGVDLRLPTLVIGVVGAALYVFFQVRSRNRQIKAGIAGSSQLAWLARSSPWPRWSSPPRTRSTPTRACRSSAGSSCCWSCCTRSSRTGPCSAATSTRAAATRRPRCSRA